jgi:hypothetical protein
MTSQSIKSLLLHAAWAGITGIILYALQQVGVIEVILKSNLGEVVGAIAFAIISAFLKKAADDLKINQ